MTQTEYAVGIDLGGTFIKCGVCSAAGEIVEQFQLPSGADQPVAKILGNLITAARNALEIAATRGLRVSAVGIGTPGSVDVAQGYLDGNTPNFRHWKNVPLREELQSVLSLPVIADNDANMMAYGEARLGAGQGHRNIVCITLGTGIGGGILIDGRLFRGSRYAGSEVGHMSIDFDGKQCRCGGRGCWERYASASAFLEHYRELRPEAELTSTRELFRRFAEGETAAGQVIEQGIEMIAVGVANLVNIFNPDVFIIGGGVSEAGEWFIERISAAVSRRAMQPSLNGVKIVPAQLGNTAGWLGAALLALEETVFK